VKQRRTLFSMVAVAALASASWVVVAPSASGDPAPNVTICHRTNSVTNPYVQETVDESSVDGDSLNDNPGQPDHLLEHTGPLFDSTNPPPPPHNGDQWGDIIPPFDVNGDPRPDPTLTLNWPEGQAIFENDCNLVDFGNVAVQKLVVNPDAVTTPATFTIHLVCTVDLGAVNVLDETVTLAADETSDSFQVQAGASCDATEDSAGIADLVSVVSSGPVTVVVDDDVLVTITNTFAATPEVIPTVVEVSPEVVVASPVQASPGFTG
jgi:hypothetical protein